MITNCQNHSIDYSTNFVMILVAVVRLWVVVALLDVALLLVAVVVVWELEWEDFAFGDFQLTNTFCRSVAKFFNIL